MVDAGDLQVVAENQAVYFLNPLTGETLATMDPLYVYDSFAGDSPHTTYGNDLLCTRLEDGTYEITMVVDEAFLNDPATVYPVVVDPSLTISASGIEDATIYTNYKVTDGKTSQALYVGSYTARYGSRGVARTLMQFPGLLTNSTFAAIPTAQINSVKLYLRDLQCEVDTVRIDCYRSTFSWNEATVKCSQNLWNGYDSTLLDYASVHYNGGTTGPGTTDAGNWYDFNITSAVKYWKNGGYTNGGIILKASNESSGARTFASSERGSYTPVVMVDYGYAVSQVCLNTTNMEMEINDTAYLRASVVPAAASQSVYFTSSNPNVVSVGATGLLCAKSAGTAVITVVSAVDSSKFASCRVKVLKKAIIIVPGIMGTELKLELAEGKFAAGTKVWPPMEENEEAGLDTIAKLKLIRPLDSALTVNNDDNYGTFDEYKSLYNYLEQNFGSRYDVVFFGYDWRRPNGVSAQLLKEKVNTYDKSIIIAHSMGGLVASHLVKNADNHSKIEKVITLGTPFLGSLEMLPVFAEGDLSAIDNALKDVNPILAFFAKNLMLRPVLKELAVDIPSLYELLPNQMFFSLGNRHCLSIMSAGEQQLVTYEQTKQYLPYFIPDMEQGYFKNAILYNNSLWSGNTHCTSTVNSYYIIGEGVDTLRTYTAQFEVQNNIYSASFVQSGDGSVLSYSASMNDLYPSKTFFVNSGHGDLTKLNDDKINEEIPEILNFIRNLINGSTTLTKGIRTEPNKPI